MADYMELDGASATSPSLKRPRALDTESEACQTDDQMDVQPHEGRLKRVRNSRTEGGQQQRHWLKYNAGGLLNRIAYQQLYVTKNFHEFNARRSSVILYMMSSECRLHGVICEILPTLYWKVAQNVQALAIGPEASDGSYQPAVDTSALPVISVGRMDDDVARGMQRFRQALPRPSEILVIIDSAGRCRWTSDELMRTLEDEMEDGDLELRLRDAMTGALLSIEAGQDGLEMEDESA